MDFIKKEPLNLLKKIEHITKKIMQDSRKKDEKYWKTKLSDEQYEICRLGGTERPFTGKYLKNKKKGMYNCAACGHKLFDSKTKFESGTGWPSFWDVYDKDNIELKEDKSLGMNRVEVLCSNCGSHLGHLFKDGPRPTGLRYCINSTALNFEEKNRLLK